MCHIVKNPYLYQRKYRYEKVSLNPYDIIAILRKHKPHTHVSCHPRFYRSFSSPHRLNFPQWYSPVRLTRQRRFLHDELLPPVKKDDISRWRHIAPVLKPSPAPEPRCPVRTAWEFRDLPAVYIAALVGAPRHKTCTPWYPSAVPIPAPVRSSSFVPFLR